ncbi:MAG: hypothetical protein KDK30_08490 [Leptospiraceae bacterium]|nr:hypothetical protein [Leptospiraceae bacterium]
MRMLYFLAILLILVGAACLAYVGYGIYTSSGPGIGANRDSSVRGAEPGLSAQSKSDAGDSAVSDIAAGTDFSPHETDGASRNAATEPAARVPTPEQATVFKRIDTDTLQEALKIVARTESTAVKEPEQFITRGVLYQDHGRRIPGRIGRVEDMPVRYFQELRRVGRGTLIIEGSTFMIHCGNASYSYSAGDLEQIVFQPGGVALVPLLPDRPVPVFITHDSEGVKKYIKRHARIKAAS